MLPFENIKKIDLSKVNNGFAENIPELYDKLIRPQFENSKLIKEIHHTLVEYINSNDPIFFIRLYGSYTKKNYELQRRGFLTEYSDNMKVSFCDNTFTLLFAEMKLANINYSSLDLKKLLSQKKLIVGFGQVSEEKELCFYTPKDAIRAKLNVKGWYQAHIKPTGYGYNDLDLKTLFPNPPRIEFQKEDRIRHINEKLTSNQLRILKAHFLRLIHPFNSFLVPKKNQLSYSGKNIGEENELINFVRKQIKKGYPIEYEEFDNLSIEYNIEESKSFITNIQWFEKPINEKKIISKKIDLKKMEKLTVEKNLENERSEIDLEIKLENTLRAIGKEIFATVLYPELIKNIEVSYEEISNNYTVYNSFTINSQKSRLSKAKSIFREGEETEALLNIYESKKIKNEVKLKIVNYLNINGYKKALS
ncbi:hypothetical protein SLW70_03430 [Flavobacterium sp. NG2]|uniref:hypothetical protein n=1 Tax=Flavobacterium sp. NG2 TaxID=3097547 RepID=UPI002A7FC67E|nr:hypothetical protein [Flavobacterium sp. NG2]WPR72205.1 hypothetical protein SLW70_03430 [Flavobacterium sp. NG2]